jgi:hypothetical protein
VRDENSDHERGPASVHAVIETIRELTSLMSRETELLRALQVKNFSKLQERKLALISAYEAQSDGLRKDPAFAQTLEPMLRDELKDVTARMHDVMRENQTAINAARDLNNRVATAIVEAIQSERPENALYSGHGDQRAAKNAPPLSVQLDGHY